MMHKDFAEQFESIVGRSYLRGKLLRLESEIQRTPPRLELASNPIMRYLRDTTQIGSRRIFYNRRGPTKATDGVYFNLVSRLLDYLNDEISANQKYKHQCFEKLLARDEGPFLSILAELICAGFLKSIGQEVSFNSSAETGMPDVISTKNGISLGHDAKMFADEDILFVSKVNRMLPDFVRDYRGVRNVTLQAMVSDIKGFNSKKLKNAVENFLSRNKPRSDGIWITSLDYKGDQGIEINLRDDNFSLRIIPSQPLDQAVNDFSASLVHSIEQIRKAGLGDGISWGFFTHDNDYGQKQMIVQHVTDVVAKHVKSGFGLILMEFRPVIHKGDISIKCQVFEIGLPETVELTQPKLETFLDILDIRY